MIDQLLPLMESYYTIQGEGANTGMPAYFIRLGGCDVGCHWCDVKESWAADKHPLVSIEKIIDSAEKCSAKNAVITGGEPLLYNLDLLTKTLQEKGIKTYLETSGAYPLTGTWNWICLSPKKTKLPLKGIFQKANELKVIVYNNDDFRFGEEMAQSIGRQLAVGSRQSAVQFFLQPEWSMAETILPTIIGYVKKNPRWRISLQTHKYIGIP